MIYLMISAVCFIFFFIKSLDLLYLFQIKEYRIDRFLLMLKETGYVRTLYGRIPRMPKKSPRNVIVAGTAVFLYILMFGYFIRLERLPRIGLVMMYPVISLAAISPGLLITHIVSLMKKNALIGLARKKMSESDAVCIGITGSYGKTTTKDYLAAILSQQFCIAKTDEHMNTDTGVAISVLNNLNKDTQYFIAEMGAYRKGEIAAICSFTKPRLGILTGIGNQHLGLFGTKEKLIETKKELLVSLPETGHAFVNTDTVSEAVLSRGVKAAVHPFSHKDSHPLIPPEAKGIIVADLIPCLMLAKHIGMDNSLIKKGVETIIKQHNRLLPKPGHNRTLVIDDSYNANLNGMLLLIQSLADVPRKQKYIVTRGIIELGTEKASSYHTIASALHGSSITLLTTDPDFGESDHILFFSSEKQLNAFITQHNGPETVLAFAGKYDTVFLKTATHI